MNLNRRKLIGNALGAAVVGLGGAAGSVKATPEEAAEAIKALAGDAEIGIGIVKLTIPEIAENGNSVPISVHVESPMTAADYVESVFVYSEGNPHAEVVGFNFSPASGEASVSTRMRLAETQNVIALAKMSDGSIFSDTRSVKVTIGGCGG